jgi:polysaccharide deacetylase 2 family uncharacterized protein YibQ
VSLRTARRLVSVSIVLWLFACASAAQEARIAMIIDDVGNQLGAGQRSVALPGPVALAILPHTPYARLLAEDGAASGKEILVHMPMQASDAGADPGPGSLWLNQDIMTIEDALEQALAAVPYASGVSNHMGSLLTRDPQTMHTFMQWLARRETLFFVDSYTTHLSVGLLTAREHGIAALKRDVFIDADVSESALDAAWNRLLEQARSFGFAIGIAHPQAATLEFLEKHISALEDVELVSLRELLLSNLTQISYAEAIGVAPISDFAARDAIH